MSSKIVARYESEPWMLDAEEINIEDFYCKEDPFEVLKILGKQYYVYAYKDLKNLWMDTVLEKGIDFSGLKIEEFNPNNGLSVSGSIVDYNIPVEGRNNFLGKPQMILSNFIARYLFEAKDPMTHLTVMEMDRFDEFYPKGYPEKVKVTNYFNQRYNKKIPEKEEYLKQILEYSEAVYGKEFGNLKALEKIAKKVDKNISREYTPLYTADYNLQHLSLHQNS